MYTSLESFTSAHGYDYIMGQEISDVKYMLLSHDDKRKFQKKADLYWDDPNPSSPVMATTMMESSFDTGPIVPIADEPTFGGFGGGDGGGGGAGGDWGSSASDNASNDSTSSSDYSGGSDSNSSSYDSGSSSSDSSSSFDAGGSF